MPRRVLSEVEALAKVKFVRAVNDLMHLDAESVGRIADHVGEEGTGVVGPVYDAHLDAVVVECLRVVVDAKNSGDARKVGRPRLGDERAWSNHEAKTLAQSAQRMFSEGHSYRHGGVDADNCSYCALTTGGDDGPNYAGWARLYVEARVPIPERWRAAFQREVDSGNKAYASALQRSIATFGAPEFEFARDGR